MVEKILPIVSARQKELDGALSRADLPEYLAAIALRQMSALAKAVSILEQDSTLDADTSTPATVLARIAVEGLIYVNYLIDDDIENRATSFLCSEIMWREGYEDDTNGRPWRRAHGTCGLRDRSSAFGFRLTVKVHEEEWCDKYERDFIQAALRDVTTLEVRPPAGMVTATDWRFFWNGLGRRLTGRALAQWKSMNRRWNLHRRWPFGLTPDDARRDGHLDDHLKTIVENDPSADRGRGQEHAEALGWTGDRAMAVFSLLAHFSPARTGIDPGAFSGFAAITHIYALWVVVRLLAKRYAWAKTLQDTV